MKFAPRLRWLVVVAALAAVAMGLIVALTPLHTLWRSTAQFSSSSIDPRVHFEPGAEQVAAIVARALPEAIATVERQQYRPFAKPVAIYVCASPESLASFGGPRSAGGFVLNGRLFVASKPQNTAERLPGVLAHELSHLHTDQQLGMIDYASKIPSWFKEGLAVLVSASGAETVSAAEARAAIANGKSFTPPMSGRLLFERSGRTYGLPEHMWYRQSALLVQFLRERDEAAFRQLLRRLDQGVRFKTAFEASYPQGMNTLLQEFRSGKVVSLASGGTPSQRP